MTIEVDGPSGVITVYTDELQLAQSSPTVIYDHSMDDFWRKLRVLEESEAVRTFPRILDYNQPFDVGVELAATSKITDYWTITYVDGQYSVNLRGMNTNVSKRVNRNQVSVWPENSAGLTFAKEIERQSYVNGTVWYDAVKGKPGTNYPRGIPTDPVNNIPDLLTLLSTLGLSNVYLKSSLTLDRDIIGIRFFCNLGVSVFDANGFKADICVFERISLKGDFNGSSIVSSNCSVKAGNTISNVYGELDKVKWGGTIRPFTGEQLTIIDYRSSISGLASPVLDMNPGLPVLVSIRNGSGGILVKHCDHPNDLGTIELDPGRFNLDPTCTAGLLSLRGIGFINKLGAIGTILETNSLIEPNKLNDIHGQIRRELWVNTNLTNPVIDNGYQQSPYSILDNAITDSEANGITVINSYSDVKLTRNFKNIELRGISSPTVDMNEQDVKGSKFWNVILEGLSTQRFIVQQSYISEGAGLQGVSELCIFTGDVILTGKLEVINGNSGKEGAGYISFITGNNTFQVTNWHRSLGVKGMLSGIHTIEMYGGQLHLDAACLGGIIHLRGNYSKPPINLGTTVILDETEKADLLSTTSFP